MKRRLFWWVIAFMSGIYLSVIFGLAPVFTGALATLLAYILKLFIRPSESDVSIIICVIFLFTGAFYVTHESKDTKSFLKSFKGQTVTLSARVKDFPLEGSKYFSFDAEITSLEADKGKYIFRERSSVRLYDEACSLAPGDIVTLEAKILTPQVSERISQDYSLYLKTKKIYTILSVKSGKCSYVSSEKPTFSERLTIMRKNLADHFYRYLPNREAALASAMLLGDKSQIDSDMQEMFSLSGLAHIIAVSGLHVNAICALLYALFKYFGLNKRLALTLSVIVILIYVPLTGMSPSAVRAGITTVLFIVSQLIFRRADSLTSLAFAALIITIANPFYAFSVSFMLSFGATLGILIFAEPTAAFLCRRFKIDKSNKIRYVIFTSLSLTLSAQVFTAPVIISYFGTFTLWSLVTNIIAVPLLLPLLAGGMLLIIADLIISPLAKLAAFFVLPLSKGMLFICDFFAKLPFGIIKAEMSGKALLLYILIITLAYIYLHLDEKTLKENKT